jgi:hypothetical protein
LKFDINMDDNLFFEKVRRDMLSIVHDPLLISSDVAESLQATMRKSVERFLRLHSDRLLRIVSRPEPRLPLGKWFERVFLAALQISLPFSEVLHSVRHEDGGELDFIVVTPHRLMHIEYSMKFFLYTPFSGQGLSRYVGPGGQDRLDLKLNKMRSVQLRRAMPKWLQDDRPVERILWMGGRIHLPLRNHDHWVEGSQEINKNCSRGFWQKASEFFNDVPFDGVFVHLPRQWWMTSLTGLPVDDLKSFATLTSGQGVEEAIMLALVQIDDLHVREVKRGFVLPG